MLIGGSGSTEELQRLPEDYLCLDGGCRIGGHLTSISRDQRIGGDLV